VTLAKAAQAVVSALLVVSRAAGSNDHRRREAHAVAEEISRIARHYATRVATMVRTDVSAGEAILDAAGQAGRNLVVMGVSRRPGDVLSFGEVAAALLERSPCSLLFVAPAAAKAASKPPVVEEALAPDR
jgi:nucleotide-binding universal stress UspA family protein